MTIQEEILELETKLEKLKEKQKEQQKRKEFKIIDCIQLNIIGRKGSQGFDYSETVIGQRESLYSFQKNIEGSIMLEQYAYDIAFRAIDPIKRMQVISTFPLIF
jgi:hypothetical protein